MAAESNDSANTQPRARPFAGALAWAGQRLAVAIAALCALSGASNPSGARDAYPQVRESMIAMSKQLGVTCSHCHDVNDFKSPEKPSFKIAKAHMRVVETLNGPRGFAGKPKVDCYVCHQGRLQVEIKAPPDDPGAPKVHGGDRARDHGGPHGGQDGEGKKAEGEGGRH